MSKKHSLAAGADNIHKQSRVKVFWLPKELCQSYEQEESKACTLITILMVQNCHLVPPEINVEEPSDALVLALERSIRQGNDIYKRLSQADQLTGELLNIPEARLAVTANTSVNAVVQEWDSFFHEGDLKSTFWKNLTEHLRQWWSRPNNSQADVRVVVLANLRAVLLVISKTAGSVALVDSHGHCPYGGVIVQASLSYLSSVCAWYARQLEDDTGPVHFYELSFLYCDDCFQDDI